MRLIVGLGNPGAQYALTRHNVGFMVVDRLAEQAGCSISRARFGALVGDGTLAAQKVLLLKPQTFMNLSGRSLEQAVRYYDVLLENVVVIHDDVDLPFGRMKLKQGGGHAGHKGLKSIDQVLGTDYVRVRLGVGRPPGRMEVANFVLSAFSTQEREELDFLIGDAADAVRMILDEGLVPAMNRYNGVRPPD